MSGFQRGAFQSSAFQSDDALAAPNKYTNMLMNLLPPGKVWRWVGSLLYDLLAACADELGRIEDRATDLMREAIPSTAVELLPDYERELELPSTGANADRQARIVARLVARQRVRPIDYQSALAPLLGQDPADVVVIERSHAFAVTLGDTREIYRFFVYRDPALPGTYQLDAAQSLIDTIKHSHTIGTVIESVSFLTDDPHSLTDRDLLGA